MNTSYLRELLDRKRTARDEMRHWAHSARAFADLEKTSAAALRLARIFRDESLAIDEAIQAHLKNLQGPGGTTTFLKRYNSIGCQPGTSPISSP